MLCVMNHLLSCALMLAGLLAGCGGSDDSAEDLTPQAFNENGLRFIHPASWKRSSKSIWPSTGPDVVQEVSFRKASHFVTILRMRNRQAAERLFRSSQNPKSGALPAEDSLGDMRWWTIGSSTTLAKGAATIHVLQKHYVTHRGDSWFYVWIQTPRGTETKTGKVIAAPIGEESLKMLFDSIMFDPAAATPK